MARERVDERFGNDIERFVRKYFELVSPDDLLSVDRKVLLGSVLSLWELGEDRKPGESKVRLFNPSKEKDGWSIDHTLLEVVNDDMPFLVDSLTAELQRGERNIHLVIHPVVSMRRREDGARVPADQQEGEVVPESYMHVQLDRETTEREIESLVDSMQQVLSDVRVAVADWYAMRERMTEALEEISKVRLPIPEDEVEEAREFLHWLDDEHFIFLGFRQYRFVTEDGQDYLKLEKGSGLGILREVRQESDERGTLSFTPEFSRFARRKELIVVAKANSRSTVHRPVHMDRISIKRFNEEGNVIGEYRFLGLFTSVAYSRSVKFIPMLRRKARRTLERAGLAPNSHAGKALAQILETLPRDELFQISEDELFNMSLGILQLQERQRIALFVRQDVFERFISCLVYVPRDRYDSQLREKIRVILEVALGGQVTAFYTQMTDSPLARAHFIVKTTPGMIGEYDIRSIEGLIAEAARNWSDHLKEHAISRKGEERGLEVYRRYKDAFPTPYRERFSAGDTLVDIDRIEGVLGHGGLNVDLYSQPSEEIGGSMEIRCKFINTGTPLSLSDIVPRLENMGLKVQMAIPYEVRPEGTEPVRVRDFLVSAPGAEIDLKQIKGKFEDAFLRAWMGEVEDDGFNRLVICAGLDWSEILILRAYTKFLRQIGVAFSEAYMQATLGNNPGIAELLVRLFKTQFDPELGDEERSRTDDIRQQIESSLDSVSNLDEDRILRRYLNVIEATIRTNYFQRSSDGERKSYFSMKFDSQAVKEMPRPRPMYEIFVYSPRFEGVHLRAGMVARGGLRWSDRREDFRREILGLVKAQVVKNAVIVPVGSKGGFVLKQAPLPAEREAFMAEGIACYKNFLRGLLDLTDNLVHNEVVPPRDVVRRDGDDTYLVVAADKGTATFSDIANSISAEYGFWLGDAFASGGSAGYDHKKMGITARGAWEAVKRHFRELGLDTQSEEFSVVGVGDMSGDVFGNGMLLSPHLKLVAAFNHLHILVDPDPDPQRSWKERKRLFDLPRSAWSDYDPEVLSAGGAVYERSAKVLNISPQVQKRFDLPADKVSPNELMQAILRARADLLWLGGIGTYVKSSDESDADAQDRANDPIRVDAEELRVRVVGEGANLGLTQRGRIEFALHGGKINTDAIDNSAGVDTSDHEVNIKILLDAACRQGALTGDDRDPLLAQMTDEVAQLVLRDNYQQTQAISVTETQGIEVLDQQARLMKMLEKSGRLDRRLEGLPDDETLTERQAANRGLTRPEIAVLLAYSKIWVYQELLESDLPDDPLLVEDLLLYFPEQLRERFRGLIEGHRLRREIVATFVTNSMVNRVGPSFVSYLMEETGRSVSAIARAYTISRESFGLRNTWRKIERLDNQIPASLQISMLIEMGKLIERTTLWFLRTGRPLDISRTEAEYRPRIMALARSLEDTLPANQLESLRQRAKDREASGIPRTLAHRLASLDIVGSFPDIVRISTEANRGVTEAGRVYFELGSRLEFDTLRAAAEKVGSKSLWERAAVSGIIEDLFEYQGELTSKILHASPNGDPDEAIERWFETKPDVMERAENLLGEIRAASSIDLAMLTVASRQLRAVAG
ncbi:MAG: NAD-glutamate dehydrogenase [Acidobacteria bacterium]|nr:NAD-glutamate dehydrogenase [Acidobacteriota bacterium]